MRWNLAHARQLLETRIRSSGKVVLIKTAALFENTCLNYFQSEAVFVQQLEGKPSRDGGGGRSGGGLFWTTAVTSASFPPLMFCFVSADNFYQFVLQNKWKRKLKLIPDRDFPKPTRFFFPGKKTWADFFRFDSIPGKLDSTPTALVPIKAVRCWNISKGSNWVLKDSTQGLSKGFSYFFTRPLS